MGIGYWGEDAGLVVLKRYSAAVADGDDIHGILVGSAVNQISNDVSITVPVSQSQSAVYRRALQRARMDAEMDGFPCRNPRNKHSKG